MTALPSLKQLQYLVALDKQTGTGKVIISASGGGGGGSGGASALEELADVTVVGQTAGAALVSNGTVNEEIMAYAAEAIRKMNEANEKKKGSKGATHIKTSCG